MSGMSKIVKTISGIAFPFITIYGLYVIAHGHLTPGGGFQGGAIVASGCAMVLVSYGSIWTMNRVKEKNLSILESLGAVCFILWSHNILLLQRGTTAQHPTHRSLCGKYLPSLKLVL